MLGEVLLWDDLSHIELQCVFDNNDHNKRYRVKLDSVNALSERGGLPLAVSSGWLDIPNSEQYPHGQFGTASGATFAPPIALATQGPNRPPAPRAPFERLSPEQQRLLWELVNHVADNVDDYSLSYWIANDRARGEILAGLGASFDASFTPVATLGSHLVFHKLASSTRPEAGLFD